MATLAAAALLAVAVAAVGAWVVATVRAVHRFRTGGAR